MAYIFRIAKTVCNHPVEKKSPHHVNITLNVQCRGKFQNDQIGTFNRGLGYAVHKLLGLLMLSSRVRESEFFLPHCQFTRFRGMVSGP